MTTTREMNSVKDLAEYILERHPEARNSDNALYFTMCRHLGAETFEDLEKLNLSIISVHKIRQAINREGKFLPDEDVRKERGRRRTEIKDYMARLVK